MVQVFLRRALVKAYASRIRISTWIADTVCTKCRAGRLAALVQRAYCQSMAGTITECSPSSSVLRAEQAQVAETLVAANEALGSHCEVRWCHVGLIHHRVGAVPPLPLLHHIPFHHVSSCSRIHMCGSWGVAPGTPLRVACYIGITSDGSARRYWAARDWAAPS